jgi:flagellar biosynthesis protein FliP
MTRLRLGIRGLIPSFVEAVGAAVRAAVRALVYSPALSSSNGPAAAASLKALAACALLISADAALAQALPGITAAPGPGGSTTYSLPVQTLLILSALTFLPAMLLLMTGFTRIVIVLSLLRHALGTQTSPPNQVVIGLALFLTLFVMSPTLDRIYTEAYAPYTANQLSFQDAIKRGEVPLKSFMLKQVREPDLALFLKLSGKPPVAKAEDLPLSVVVPAFVTSELKTAFQIGFMIFIPFLVIDLVVASVLMSMGMMMLSPVLISLPFKLILFVLVDGWNLLAGSLIASFHT